MAYAEGLPDDSLDCVAANGARGYTSRNRDTKAGVSECVGVSVHREQLILIAPSTSGNKAKLVPS